MRKVDAMGDEWVDVERLLFGWIEGDVALLNAVRDERSC